MASTTGGGGLALGLDFGTESVRALFASLDGRIASSAEAAYTHGQITPGSAAAARLFPGDLPPAFALQHPGDWLPAASLATRRALAAIGDGAASRVVGIGVDFTSCTVLAAHHDGAALATSGAVDAGDPHAWPKLWKHHGAGPQARHLTQVAAERGEPWLSRYGGTIGLEWFFPKILEVIEASPQVADAADVWLEAGDWLVWQLVGSVAAGGTATAADLVRSTCQAGYKGQWSPADGFPSADYLEACHPALADVRATRLPGRFVAPGARAGSLCAPMASQLGLPAGLPVSAAIIDAHAGVPGAGVGRPNELVLVLGTSGCHMLMDPAEHRIAGVAGVVADGILPGMFGYETGQAAVGDAFDWVRRVCGEDDHQDLARAAAAIAPGSDGLVVIDWVNGCRTPLMDGRLGGAVLGAHLHHGAAHLYRAALEGSAAGLRWIVETLRDGGVAIERMVATGGLPRHNPLFVEILASVLDEPIHVSQVDHGPALGAAILGALAADCFPSADAAVDAMAGPASHHPPCVVVRPAPGAAAAYDAHYRGYRRAAAAIMDLAAADRADSSDTRGTPDRPPARHQELVP